MPSFSRQVLTRIRRGLHAALADLPTPPAENSVQVVRAEPPPPAEAPPTPHTSKTVWADALQSEIAFWDKWFGTKGGEWPDDYKARLDPQTPLADFVEAYLPTTSGDTVLDILDVGSGPLTKLGYRSATRKVRITPVDPLADAYDRVMEKHGVTPPVRTTWCHGELLRERFTPESFDLVWAQNSLDHSYDPVKIIEQALTLTKVGGYLVLAHVRNEAVTENYDGLHQWNFDGDGTDFIIWNREKRVNMTQRLRHRAEIRTRLDPTFVEVSFRKTVSG